MAVLGAGSLVGTICASAESLRAESHSLAGPRELRCKGFYKVNGGIWGRTCQHRFGRLASLMDWLGRSRWKTSFPQLSMKAKAGEVAADFWGAPVENYSFYQNMDAEEVDITFLWHKRLRPKLGHLSRKGQSDVRRGLAKAFAAHDGQMRISGEPFITHPVEVARILGELKLDSDTLVAGLLHDTVEDTDYWTFEDIENEFGPTVRRIVEGETRFSKIAGGNVQEGELEDAGSLDFQHFFTTMTKDVRIVLVKLADRLHNMRTLESMAPHKQKKKAKETLKYFAPLALMLGLEAATNELEELSLKFIEPDKYRELKRELQQVNQEMEASMKGPRDSLMNHLQACDYLSSQVKGIDIKVQRMPLYKLYEKLLDTGWDLSRNTLLKHDFRLKIELDEKEGSPGPMICYHVLGLVHELWTPIPQTMKDLIHSPVADREKGLITMVWPTAVSGTRLVMPLAVRICTTEMAQSRCMMPPVLHGASNGGKNSVHETSGSLPHKQMNGKSNVDQPLGKEIERKLANHNTLEFNFRLHLWTDGFLRFLKRGNNFNGSDKANGTSSQVEKETMKLSSHGTGFIQAEEWLESVKKFQMGIEGKVTAREFVECMRDDFLVQSVYVLTPMGEVVQLPVGATALDFAYYIHTDVGNRATACKVNGIFVPPYYQLQNAEVVEIFTCDGPLDHAFLKMLRGRVDILQTKMAKTKLRNFVNMLEEELGNEDCRHEALSILDSKFAQQSTLWLTLKCEDRRGILSEVSRLISSHDMSIKEYSGSREGEDFVMKFDLGSAAFCPVAQLATLCAMLSNVPGIFGWETGCTLPENDPESKKENVEFNVIDYFRNQ